MQSERTSIPPIGGVIETALYVDDLARSQAFYQDPFGFTVAMEPIDRMVVLNVTDDQVFLARRPPGRRCFLGHSPPGCSLVAPCQANASSGKPRLPFSANYQNREALSQVSDRAQLASRSASMAGSTRPCDAIAVCSPKSDQPLCGWSAISSR